MNSTDTPAAQPVQLVLPATRPTKPPAPRRGGWLDVAHPASPGWRRYGPVWGSLAATTGALAAVPAWAVTPLPLAAAATVAGAAGAVVSGAVQDMPGRRLWWRAGCWAAAGCWTGWAAASTAWGAWQLGTLTLGAAVGGIVAHVGEQRRLRDAIARAAGAAEAGALAHAAGPAREWAARIARVCDVQVTVEKVDPWPTGTGYTVHTYLPAGGASYQHLAREVVGLASDADLPVGCEVTLRRGETRRRVLLDVTTVAGSLEKVVVLPEPVRRSINDDLDVGVLRTGAPALVNLRYHCVVLAGQTDAGKSNQLQVVNARVAECDDAVLWHIDLTGGNLSRAWVRPWYREESGHDHPIVDWVAADEAQAEAMLRAALAIIDGRRSRYDHVMEEAGDDKIPVSPELPEIVIVVDEIHRLPQHLRRMLVDISDTGRGAGVRTVACGLRAVETYLPGAIVAQARVRLGMRVSDEKEVAYLFGWRQRVDPDSMPYQGCGLLYQGEPGQESLVPFRGYRLAPPRIAEVARVVQEWRPELDNLSAQLADQATRGAHTRRWEAAIPLLFPGGTATAKETSVSEESSGEPARRRDDLVERLFGATAEERQRVLDEGARRGEQRRRERAEYEREAAADRAAVELSLSGCGITTEDRLMALVEDAGSDGIEIGRLEHLAVEHQIGSRATVHRALSRLADAGRVVRPRGRVIAAKYKPAG